MPSKYSEAMKWVEDEGIADMSGKNIDVNSDGTVTLYHRTTPEASEIMNETGRFISKENTNETFFSNKPNGQAEGYGDAIVVVRIPAQNIRINDAFKDEIHVAVKNTKLNKSNIIPHEINISKRLKVAPKIEDTIHRGTNTEAIKVAEQYGLSFDGIQEGYGDIPKQYTFTVQRGEPQIKGATFYVEKLSDVSAKLPEKMKEFGIPEVVPKVVRRLEIGEAIDFTKPQGVYFTVGEVSPFPEIGVKEVRALGTTQNTLEVSQVIVKHPRFGVFGSGEGSAGIGALKKLVSEAEFDRLLGMNKDDLARELSNKFPKGDYSKYTDSYELLEAYGGQLARQKGYDAIIQIDKQVPQFSEFVALSRNAIKDLPEVMPKVGEGMVSDITDIEDIGQHNIGKQMQPKNMKHLGNYSSVQYLR